MTHRAAAPVGRRCPLVWWATTYGLSFPLLDSALRFGPHSRMDGRFPYALVVAAGASFLGSMALEAAWRRGSSCSIGLWRARARFMLFVVGAVVGLFVIYPGTSIMADVEPVFRILGAFGIMCVAASVAHHFGLEHRETAQKGLLRILGSLVRTPLWILVGIIVVLAASGIVEIVYDALNH